MLLSRINRLLIEVAYAVSAEYPGGLARAAGASSSSAPDKGSCAPGLLLITRGDDVRLLLRLEMKGPSAKTERGDETVGRGEGGGKGGRDEGTGDSGGDIEANAVLNVGSAALLGVAASGWDNKGSWWTDMVGLDLDGRLTSPFEAASDGGPSMSCSPRLNNA